MRILVNDYAGHPFQLQLSRNFAKMGHEVVHTYFDAYPTPKGRTSADVGVSGTLRIQPIDIGRSFKQHSAWSRLGADRAYGTAVAQCIERYRPDVVLSANTPLDAQKRIQKSTRKAGGRFIFWLQDVLSVAIEFVLRKRGVPLAGLAGSIYGLMERRLLERSDAIVCIAPEFLEQLRRWDISPDKTFVIENWAPLDDIEPQPRETVWAREQGLSGKTVFLYSGTLGMKHQPELLLQLALKYQNRDDVCVVVVAQGAGADWLRDHAAAVAPDALRLLPLQPYERHSEVLASGDVLITLLDEECGSFAVPSKMLAYLCAGRSLLVAAPKGNLVTKIVGRSCSGEATGTDHDSFLHGAEKLLESAEFRATCAANARAYALETFSIDAIYAKFMQAVATSLGKAEKVSESYLGEVTKPS